MFFGGAARERLKSSNRLLSFDYPNPLFALRRRKTKRGEGGGGGGFYKQVTPCRGLRLQKRAWLLNDPRKVQGGQAHSTTLRALPSRPYFGQVLDCASPLALFPAQTAP